MPSPRRSHIPEAWPRWLNKEFAAAYTGRVGKDGEIKVRTFLKEVREGKWPPAGDKSRNELYWDRLALDRASDSISSSDHVSDSAGRELLAWSQS